MLAADPMSRYQYLPLTPQEAYLLSRIDGVFDVEALLKIGGTSRGATAKTLYALLSCGIVEWKKEGVRLRRNRRGIRGAERRGPGAADAAHTRASELIKNTYRRIDWLTHYELLGVGPEATPEEIDQAYFERSRLFHPDLRHRADLAAFGKELDRRVRTPEDRERHPLRPREAPGIRRQRHRALPSPSRWPRRRRTPRRASIWRPRASSGPGSSSRRRTSTRPSRCCARRSASSPTTPSTASRWRRWSSRTPSGSTGASRT